MIAIDTQYGRKWLNLDQLDFASDVASEVAGQPVNLKLHFSGGGDVVLRGESASLIRAELEFRAKEYEAEEALYRETLARSAEQQKGGPR